MRIIKKSTHILPVSALDMHRIIVGSKRMVNGELAPTLLFRANTRSSRRISIILATG